MRNTAKLLHFYSLLDKVHGLWTPACPDFLFKDHWSFDSREEWSPTLKTLQKSESFPEPSSSLNPTSLCVCVCPELLAGSHTFLSYERWWVCCHCRASKTQDTLKPDFSLESSHESGRSLKVKACLFFFFFPKTLMSRKDRREGWKNQEGGLRNRGTQKGWGLGN